MWGSYGPAGMLVEKAAPSVPASVSSQDQYMPYVVNDITAFFTLLVGIYSPPSQVPSHPSLFSLTKLVWSGHDLSSLVLSDSQWAQQDACELSVNTAIVFQDMTLLS